MPHLAVENCLAVVNFRLKYNVVYLNGKCPSPRERGFGQGLNKMLK
jgi:hypothetical protein